MLPFRKILFPVDYSEPCRAIIPYVKEMVRHFSAELTLVHAYGPEALALSELAITDPRLPEEARELEEQRLHQFAQETFPGQHVESMAKLGEPGSIVHQVVQHQGADLVMLATHGLGPVRRFLLGSVAAKVLHNVSAAVWTGTGSVFSGHAPKVPYRSILCAVDQGDTEDEEAAAVLKAASAFARGYDACLSLVHVVETPPPTAEIDFSPYLKELMANADFKVRELKGTLGIDAPHSVIDARIPDGIRQEALRRNADLIVTGRGHAQETFNIVSSRLYPIVRQSPCPVLSV